METFYSLYPAVKHTALNFHFFKCGILYYSLCTAYAQSPVMDKKFIKIAPHVIDTFLLLSGLTLCFMIKQYPFVDAWMTEKLLAVLAYIGLGVMALKGNRNKFFKIFAFLGAIGWLVLCCQAGSF